MQLTLHFYFSALLFYLKAPPLELFLNTIAGAKNNKKAPNVSGPEYR
jgi:hypothetical protein